MERSLIFICFHIEALFDGMVINFLNICIDVISF